MQAQQKFSYKIVFTLFKKFHNKVFKSVITTITPSVALLFNILFSVQFSRCKLRGVPSKLNNARKKRSDLGMLHETCGFVRSP